MLVMMLPTSTTNMTGFFIMMRGSSLTKASPRARRMILLSQRERLRVFAMLVDLADVQEEVFEDGAECERGEEGERADDDDGADEQDREERGVDGEGAGRGRDELLL